MVDGVWRCNPDFPQAVDSDGNLNNFIDITDPDCSLRLPDETNENDEKGCVIRFE